MAEAKDGGAAKDGNDAAAEGAAPSAGGAKKALPYLIGGALSCGLGLTAAIVTAPQDAEPAVMREAAQPPPTPLDNFLKPQRVVLEPVIANLADTGQAASSRLTLIVEVRCKDEELQRKLAADTAKNGALDAPLRDALLMLLSDKQSSELRTMRGKEVLKLELVDTLKPLLFPDPSSGAITGLYFHEFLIQ